MLLMWMKMMMMPMLMIITMVAFDVNRSDSCPSLWTMPFLTLIMALKRLIDWIVIIDYNSDDEKDFLALINAGFSYHLSSMKLNEMGEADNCTSVTKAPVSQLH